MNRKYNTKEFEEVANLLRKAFPNVALTTDIIVGFPGETDEEFETTYKFLRKINFSKMHVFKYSRRKGTVAFDMKNQIDEEVKEKRSKILIDLSNKNEEKFLEENIGKEVEVLFEQEENGYIKGHTTNYIVVKTMINKENTEQTKNNKITKVKIVSRDGLELIGTM